MKDRGVIIVGAGNIGLESAKTIAEIEAHKVESELKTINQIHEETKTFKYTYPRVLADQVLLEKPLTRAERRRNERLKSKK